MDLTTQLKFINKILAEERKQLTTMQVYFSLDRDDRWTVPGDFTRNEMEEKEHRVEALEEALDNIDLIRNEF